MLSEGSQVMAATKPDLHLQAGAAHKLQEGRAVFRAPKRREDHRALDRGDLRGGGSKRYIASKERRLGVCVTHICFSVIPFGGCFKDLQVGCQVHNVAWRPR